MSQSHRELCRSAAGWLLGQRWCRVAGYEVGGIGDQFDAIGVGRIPDPDINRLLAAERAQAAADFQARIEEAARAREAGRRPKRPSYPKRRDGEQQGVIKSLRIAVVEVKRTRSDLLADLRAGKMLRYERVGTECYLAVTSDVVGHVTRSEALADLGALGLPSTWGVLWRGDVGWSVLRAARRTRQADPAVMRLWHDRIARSLAYRVTSSTSPMAGEAA